MSFSTTPPGGDGGARPPAGASPFAGAGPGGVGGAGGVTPGAPIAPVAPSAPALDATHSPAARALLQSGTLDGPGALRVFVEEIRAVVQTQLRAGGAPPLPMPEHADDPGNAAAALLRWLRSVAADTGVPIGRLREAVDAGAVRAAATLAATPGGERLVRETLAMARDVVLRGIASGAGETARAASAGAGGAGDVRGAAGAPARPAGVTGGASTGAAGGTAASAPTAAPPPGANATPGTSGAGPRAQDAAFRVDPVLRDPRAQSPRGSAIPPGGAASRGPLADDLLANTGRGAPSSPAGDRATLSPAAAATVAARTAADPRALLGGASAPRGSAPEMMRALNAAVRSSPGDAAGALRRFASELTAGTGGRGTAWLPPAELDVVDPAASLVRWVRTAGAMPGASQESLRTAIASAHSRTLERTATAPAERALRDVVGLARDLLLAEVDGPARPAATGAAAVPATPLSEPHSNPAALRPELVIGGPPRAVRAHAPREDDERIAPVGAERRRRARADREEPVDEEAADDAARESRPMSDVDLQGPMDCIRRYFDAFHADDASAYAAQWVYPACFWSGGHWASYSDAEACIAGNAEYVREAREQGMTGGRILMLRVEPMTPTVAIVHGVFTRERADGSVLAEVEAAYTTVKTDAGWRVAVCVVK